MAYIADALNELASECQHPAPQGLAKTLYKYSISQFDNLPHSTTTCPLLEVPPTAIR